MQCVMSLLLGGALVALSLAADPEIGMDAVHMIEYWGYPAEEFSVTTSDGYILRIQHITHGKSGPTSGPKPIIFMQHGLEASSTNWITNLPNNSAGFMFADAGFDVWLGNFRGNMYGNTHKTLNSNSKEFWQFSWDEMAEFDLPATIDYVLQKTGQKELYFMGHSEGTMTVFALCSYNQEFCKKIKHFYALAPVVNLKHIKGLLHYIAPWSKDLDYILNLAGVNEFLPSDWFTSLVAKYVCGSKDLGGLCDNLMFLIAGPDSTQTNKTRVPIYVSHVPAGTSTQNIIHFAQGVNTGTFQKYDYGSAALNHLHYGQTTPPSYDITKNTVPTTLYCGDNDWLADLQDIEEKILPELHDYTYNICPNFDHLDFIWGEKAGKVVYTPIIKDIQSKEPNWNLRIPQ